jgi:bacterioferritin
MRDLEDPMQRNADGGQSSAKPFLTDVRVLRDRARQQIERGPVTDTYGGDVGRTIEILQSVLATELVCVMRYTQHSIVATGLARESVANEFAQHAREEQDHAMRVAERINQLGGAPDFNPDTLTARSAAEYQTSDDLVAMIRENLVAERIAIDHYRELIRYFGYDDPASRTMVESILTVEEEHASDMLDLLNIHGGQDQGEGARAPRGAQPPQPGARH